jgi:hypothetical protein
MGFSLAFYRLRLRKFRKGNVNYEHKSNKIANIRRLISMGQKETKDYEKVAENSYNPEDKNKSQTDKNLETVHEQINESFNQGTIDDKKKLKDKEQK